MPFDNTPDEGSGGGPLHAFWTRVHQVAGCSFSFLLPRVLGSLYAKPTAGCLGLWTVEDPEPHALLWKQEDESVEKQYTDLIASMIRTAGPCPSSEQAAEALALIDHGAIYGTRVKNVPLFLALATNAEFGAMQVAGMLSMCHMFGDPLSNFCGYRESNPYWRLMYEYFAQVDARTFFAD